MLAGEVELPVVRRRAIQENLDKLWHTMYIWCRTHVFSNGGLDPNAPRLEAEQAWENISFPKGQLTWTILDGHERNLRMKRGMLVIIL